ncbi:MtN3 and saliva related transmembrane protein [Wenyingzhuangia heitensis]|uniref:MtN3 and saliva related transmembrane protein n=1 Tax=Wenyingzhuangia heitensis TaxID=1487859 RepID=A0ABX0U487_9FLAO|nr:SemiSWEET family transporter [Wenyingzhuangia heitensis]NIJ43617.1 MtN3 and saliva related transmembrane protein [Wenyingzhuangia heitensis]
MGNFASLFGVLGAMTSSSMFFPQVWKSFKQKDTSSLSWPGLVIGMLNGFFWLMYGILKLDPYIYVTNSFFTLGAVLLLILKFKYK